MPPATKTPDQADLAAPERPSSSAWKPSQRANEIRTRRAQLKRDLKAGASAIQDLLIEPPEYLETAKVFDMLLAVPKYGRVKVNKVLVQCRISPSKTIGGLSSASAPSSSRCCAASRALCRGRVFVITGPPGSARARSSARCSSACPSWSCRSRPRRARRGPGRSTAWTTGSSPTRSSSGASSDGDFVEHAEYSGRRYGTLRSELERRVGAGRPGRARDRGPGRAPGPRRRCPRRCGSSSRRRREEALRTRLIGRGTDDPEQVEARLRDRARASWPRRTSSSTSSSTTGSRTRSTSSASESSARALH